MSQTVASRDVARWPLRKLGDLVTDAQGGFASGERSECGVAQLRMNNVTDRGTFDWSTIVRVPANPETASAFSLQPGDVLFNNTNSTALVGKSAFFEGYSERITYSNHFTRLRTNRSLLLPEFLSYWLQLQWKRRLFENICNQWIGQSAVQRDKLLSLEISLPPLGEQRQIADELRAKLGHIEKARVAAARQLEAARALPIALLRGVFDSPEARRWPRRKLGVLSARISKGESPGWQGFEYVQEGARFIRSENVLWGMFQSEPEVRIPLDFHAKLSRSSVLVNLVGASIGRSCKAPVGLGDANVNQAVAVITTTPELSADYLVLYLISPPAQRYFLEVQVEMARPNISLENLRDMEVPAPPIDEQDRIADELKRNSGKAALLRCAIQQGCEEIELLSASILSEAF